MATFDESLSQSERDASLAAEPVSPTIVGLLAQTRPWVKLISMLSFAALGLGLFGLVVTGLIASRDGGTQAALSRALFAGWLFSPILLLYIPPAIFLWRYAEGIRGLVNGGGQRALEYALKNQKSFWKLVGIYAALSVAFYTILIGGSIAVGLLGAFAKHR